MNIFKAILMLVFALLVFGLGAQDKAAPQTKIQAFLSKTGQVIRFEDTSMANIITNYAVVTTHIRKLIVGSETKYFYQLSVEAKYDTKTASLEYSDLMEVLKALDVLTKSAEKDKEGGSFDYMECKFKADGFVIGYYHDKENGIAWYMDVAEYGTDGTVYFADASVIMTTFEAAKGKIEAMMPPKTKK